MRRVVRWIVVGLGALVALAALASAAIYLLSERELARKYPVTAVTLDVPRDPDSIAEGQRLAFVHGCYNSCHGPHGEGGLFFDQPMIARIVAPDLTKSVHRYSDSELAAIIRNGLLPDGRSVVVMPSEVFVDLEDKDLVRIIAFLRSVPQSSGSDPSVSLGPLGRLGIVTGRFNTAARLIAKAEPPPEVAEEHASHGRYLARTVCAGCHGTKLEGDTYPDFTSPSLRIVAAYSADDFMRLMRTGLALGGRELRVMSPAARDNLSHMTDPEIADLYAYLRAMPEAGAASR
jgi:cytochrome c553